MKKKVNYCYHKRNIFTLCGAMYLKGTRNLVRNHFSNLQFLKYHCLKKSYVCHESGILWQSRASQQ